MNKFSSWRSYRDFSRYTRIEQRYFRNEESDIFLRSVFATSKSRERQLRQGFIFWRAQIGHGWVQEGQGGVTIETECPHTPERMTPLKDKAPEGRANPKGISYLYLATSKETAMSEVRPWVGSRISVGQFKTNRDLKVIDCLSWS
jgi:hypothetical protein